MKKEKIKKITKIIIFLAIFLIIFIALGKFYSPVGTMGVWFQTNTIKEFYREPKDTIDIAFVGNSCVYTSISPMEIYDRIGVTSYDVSTQGQRMWASYYYAKEAIRCQHPKVIFFEIGELFTPKVQNEEQSTRKALDPMKFSINKIEMALDDDFGLTNFEKLGVIFPVLRYHSRWSEIDRFDITKFTDKVTNYTFKGYLLERHTKGYKGKIREKFNESKIDKSEISKYFNMPEETKNKLDKIVEVCKKENVELIFIKNAEPSWWKDEHHYVAEEYAEQNNIKFIDLNYEDLNIDWQKDTFDGGDHLNVYGAEKVGEFFSKYIAENYNFEDRRGNSEYQKWEDMLIDYKQQKAKKSE